MRIKLRRVRWQRHVAGMTALRNTYKILVVNSEGEKKTLGRWIIKTEVTEIGCIWADWIQQNNYRVKYQVLIKAGLIFRYHETQRIK